MTKQLSNEQSENLEETVISNSYEIAALVNILERKGLITRQDILDEVKRIRESLQGMIVTHK